MELTDKELNNFCRKIDLSGSCWLWTGGVNAKGYGTLRLRKKTKMAHRVSYELIKDTIPDGKILCHYCDTPACVNPKHLYVGTCQDNMNDMIERGERIGYAKLKREQIPLIMEYEGKMFHKDIGKIFGVSQQTISRIYTGECWSFVTGIEYKKKGWDND